MWIIGVDTDLMALPLHAEDQGPGGCRPPGPRWRKKVAFMPLRQTVQKGGGGRAPGAIIKGEGDKLAGGGCGGGKDLHLSGKSGVNGYARRGVRPHPQTGDPPGPAETRAEDDAAYRCRLSQDSSGVSMRRNNGYDTSVFWNSGRSGNRKRPALFRAGRFELGRESGTLPDR